MDVTGDDLAPVLHHHRRRKGLAPRRRAGIQHLAAGGQAGGKHGQAGGRVLGIQHPLLPGRRLGQVSCSGQLKAVCQPGMGGHGDPVLLQALAHLLGREAAGVALHAHRRLAVVPAEQGFQLVRSQPLAPLFHQPPGVAVEQGEIGHGVLPVQRRQAVQMPGQIPQDAVDQAAGPGIFAVFLGQRHRLTDGGADRDLAQKSIWYAPSRRLLRTLLSIFSRRILENCCK